MNQAEIATVERLRREGKGLSAIAQETGISINTIKSHCSRHGLSGSRPIRTCMFCNTEIKTKDHFCSSGCRDGWYEIHSVDAQDILRLCKACGKPFEPCQPKQVYCSKQCFYNDRYGAIGTIGRGETATFSVPVSAIQNLASGAYGALCLYESPYNFGSSTYSSGYMRMSGTDTNNPPYLRVVYNGGSGVG